MKRLLGTILVVAAIGFVVLYFMLSPLIRLGIDQLQIMAAAALGSAAFMTAVFVLLYWASLGKAANWRLLKHKTKHFTLGRTDHGGITYLSIFKQSKFGRDGIMCFGFPTLPRQVDAGATFVIYPSREDYRNDPPEDENVIVLFADGLTEGTNKFLPLPKRCDHRSS